MNFENKIGRNAQASPMTFGATLAPIQLAGLQQVTKPAQVGVGLAAQAANKTGLEVGAGIGQEYNGLADMQNRQNVSNGTPIIGGANLIG